MLKLHRQLNVMRTAGWDSCNLRTTEIEEMVHEVDAREAELVAEVAKYREALRCYEEYFGNEMALLRACNALGENKP